jgi:pyruvate formate lyase activating enzyme
MRNPRAPTSVYHLTWAKEQGICCIFFWGCNLRCRVCLLQKEVLDCHLPETRLKIYDPAHRNPEPGGFLTLGELLGHLDRLPIKKAFLMGAEPLCEPRLPEILRHWRRTRTCSVSLLTNGKIRPPVDLLDEVIFSIKAVTPSLHQDYTGCDNRVILRHFRELAGLPHPRLYAETVFIPDYVDEAEVLRMASFIASVNPALPFRIDAYLPVPDRPWRSPGVGELESLGDRVRRILPGTTTLHGREGKQALAYEVERVY